MLIYFSEPALNVPVSLCLIVAGLALLQYRSPRPCQPFWMGWGLLFAALVVLLPLGSGYALLLWLFLLSLAGFALALQQGLRAVSKKKRKRQREARLGTTVSDVRLPRLLAMLLVTFVLSLVGLAALALWLPVETGDRALFAVLVWPMLWSVALIYLYCSRQPRRAWVISLFWLLAGSALSVVGWLV
ncbi:MAG: hypothetical protein VX379_00050 [Pseudomonadota bacterium]|nr:hypothetical protein [Pseudomonadota bacterium]